MLCNRPFKRPRHDEEEEQASADSEQGRRVHGRLASPSDSDATMADAAVAAPASNGNAPAGTPANQPTPPGLHHQDPHCLLAETAANRDKGSHGKPTNDSEHMETEEVHSSTASGANGLLPELHQNGVVNNAADSTRDAGAHDGSSIGHSHQPSIVSKPAVNGTVAAEATEAANSEANEEKVEGPPLKRMSWMESAGNGEPATNGQPATNGHLDGRTDGAVNGATDAAGAVCCWLNTVGAILVYWYIYAACCVFHLWSGEEDEWVARAAELKEKAVLSACICVFCQ